MTGYKSKRAMAQDKITDEQGRPMTYWGGKAQPALEPVDWEQIYWDMVNAMLRDKLRAQPAQEPVAFYVYKPTLPRGHLGNVSDGDLPWVYDQDPSSGYSARMLVYIAPPQRTWVGLTNNELQPIADEYRILFGSWVEDFARAIEAKLKEKNT